MTTRPSSLAVVSADRKLSMCMRGDFSTGAVHSFCVAESEINKDVSEPSTLRCHPLTEWCRVWNKQSGYWSSQHWGAIHSLCVAESETNKDVSEPSTLSYHPLAEWCQVWNKDVSESVNTEVPSTHSVSLSLKQTKMLMKQSTLRCHPLTLCRRVWNKQRC